MIILIFNSSEEALYLVLDMEGRGCRDKMATEDKGIEGFRDINPKIIYTEMMKITWSEKDAFK